MLYAGKPVPEEVEEDVRPLLVGVAVSDIILTFVFADVMGISRVLPKSIMSELAHEIVAVWPQRTILQNGGL